MLISSMIAKVDPAHAGEVARRLERIPGVTSYGVHRENNVILVAETRDEEQMEQLARHILEGYDEVWAVFPTFVASDGAEAAPPPALVQLT